MIYDITKMSRFEIISGRNYRTEKIDVKILNHMDSFKIDFTEE